MQNPEPDLGFPTNESYFQNFHPRSPMDYFYIPPADEPPKEHRRFSLLDTDLRGAKDINDAVRDIHKRYVAEPATADRWAAGVDYEKYGGINPRALPPFHCTPPYSSYNYRELRRPGKTVTETRNTYRNTYEAATVDKGWNPHVGHEYNDQFENEEDEERKIEYKEEFPPKRQPPKPKKNPSNQPKVPPKIQTLEVKDSKPSLEDAKRGVVYATVAERRKLGISIDDIKLPPSPLRDSLQYNGNRATDRLGVNFKSIAHKRLNAYYPDTVPDLRYHHRRLRYPNPIKVYTDPKF